MESFQFDYLAYLRNMLFLVVLLGAMSLILVKLKSRQKGGPTSLPRLPFLNLSASRPEESQIEVLERKVLEPRKTLYLLKIFDEQYWLVGTTDTQIEALGQVSPPKAYGRAVDPNKSFSDYLEGHETHKAD